MRSSAFSQPTRKPAIAMSGKKLGISHQTVNEATKCETKLFKVAKLAKMNHPSNTRKLCFEKI